MGEQFYIKINVERHSVWRLEVDPKESVAGGRSCFERPTELKASIKVGNLLIS